MNRFPKLRELLDDFPRLVFRPLGDVPVILDADRVKSGVLPSQVSELLTILISRGVAVDQIESVRVLLVGDVQHDLSRGARRALPRDPSSHGGLIVRRVGRDRLIDHIPMVHVRMLGDYISNPRSDQPVDFFVRFRLQPFRNALMPDDRMALHRHPHRPAPVDNILDFRRETGIAFLMFVAAPIERRRRIVKDSSEPIENLIDQLVADVSSQRRDAPAEIKRMLRLFDLQRKSGRQRVSFRVEQLELKRSLAMLLDPLFRAVQFPFPRLHTRISAISVLRLSARGESRDRQHKIP